MSSPSDINYARQFGGIHSIAAAIIFAILYIPLLPWFIFQSIRRPTYVHNVLAVFCALRIAAFIIRALLASSESAAHNLSLLVTDEILNGIGYFGLLYSAYTLVLDRELLLEENISHSFFSNLTRNRMLFRLISLGAVVMSIIGSTETSSTDATSGSNLRKASIVLFLFLTLLLVYQTVQLLRVEHVGAGAYANDKEHFGKRNGANILLLIGFLFLIREVFLTATLGNTAHQLNEHFWYPFSALPELLAVVLYATPGLVPPRSELPSSSSSDHQLLETLQTRFRG